MLGSDIFSIKLFIYLNDWLFQTREQMKLGVIFFKFSFNFVRIYNEKLDNWKMYLVQYSNVPKTFIEIFMSKNAEFSGKCSVISQASICDCTGHHIHLDRY